MTGETPLVSCVVVAFHRADALAPLIDALRHPQVDVVVVNVDNDRDVARVAGDLGIPLPRNPGYAAAVNAGVRVARAAVVVFLNDDVELTATAALDLAQAVRSGEGDLVVPCLLNAAGQREPTIAAPPTPANLLLEWMLLPDRRPTLLGSHTVGIEKWRSPVRPEVVEAASAAVVAASADWLRRVPLPEDYFLYWEESDWFWRLQAAGARVLYDPNVVARHRGGRDDVRPAKSRLLARNAVRCVRRTQGPAAATLAWPVVILWNLRLVAADGARRLAGSATAGRRLRARAVGLGAAVLAWREL